MTRNLKVGIQGVTASFHDVAARKYFSGDEVTAVECETFKILCESLAQGHCARAVMAIENTIAGSILTNYSLLERYGFKVIGEVYLPISLSLMALPGQKIDALKFVQSHPMALFQCEDFLFQNKHLKALEANDTAESAREIASKKLVGHAAIASELAAATYGLEILQSQIETNRANYTRFLVICRANEYVEADCAETDPKAGVRCPETLPDKASLRFETANEPGSLAGVLEILKKYAVNMTKIQSVPILGKPYQYSIHLDAEWTNTSSFNHVIESLTSASPPLLKNLVILGKYRKGDVPTS